VTGSTAPQGFLRDTGWSLLASVLAGPLVLIAAVVTARWLPTDAHGQLQAMLSLLALIATVGNGGLVAATIQRMRGADTPPAEAIGAGLLGVTAFGALLVGAFALGEPWLRARVLLDAPTGAYLALAALVLPTLWGSILGATARGLGRFDWWSRAELSNKGGRLLAFGALALGWPPSVPLAMAAVLAVQVGVALGLAGRVLGATGRPRLDAAELGASLRFGSMAWLTTGAHQLHERLDLVLLAVLRGDPTEVAIYAVAVGVVNRLRVVPLALASALFPHVAGMPGPEGARFTARVARVAAATAIVLGLLVAAVAPWAFPWLFGPDYAASTAPAWLLLPGAVALTPYLVLSRWFQAVDRQQVNVLALLLSVALNLGLNLWWIPTHGLLGAAGASLISYGLQGSILAVAFLRTSGLPHTELWLLRASDLRREAA